MENNSFSRKDFLKKISLFSVVAAGSSAILTACGGAGETESAEQAASAPAADPCADLTGLADSDKQMRTALGYVKEGEDPAKRCDNCHLYIPPAEGSNCGGCALFKGPVHPEGYCNSWVIKMS